MTTNSYLLQARGRCAPAGDTTSAEPPWQLKCSTVSELEEFVAQLRSGSGSSALARALADTLDGETLPRLRAEIERKGQAARRQMRLRAQLGCLLVESTAAAEGGGSGAGGGGAGQRVARSRRARKPVDYTGAQFDKAIREGLSIAEGGRGDHRRRKRGRVSGYDDDDGDKNTAAVTRRSRDERVSHRQCAKEMPAEGEAPEEEEGHTQKADVG